MKKITLFALLLLAGITAKSTTWTITSPGFSFAPATLTITLGDDVNFDIDGIHQVQEVSEATWNNNGTTPLPGGFSTPFGGGFIPASMLTVGTHYYVCTPHASMGMKGIIIVENTTSIQESPLPESIFILPNPSNGKFELVMDDSRLDSKFQLEIYDMQGQMVYAKLATELQTTNAIDLTSYPKGVYFVKLRDGAEVYSRKIVIQ